MNEIDTKLATQDDAEILAMLNTFATGLIAIHRPDIAQAITERRAQATVTFALPLGPVAVRIREAGEIDFKPLFTVRMDSGRAN